MHDISIIPKCALNKNFRNFLSADSKEHNHNYKIFLIFFSKFRTSEEVFESNSCQSKKRKLPFIYILSSLTFACQIDD